MKLSYKDLLFANLGRIIGAGIFVLIGETGRYAGKYTYISTLIAGLFILYMSQSYIKINNRYNSSDAEYLVLEEGFNKKLAKIIILLFSLGSIFGIYIVSNSFGYYSKNLFRTKERYLSMICLVTICIINLFDIKKVAILNKFNSLLGILSLILLSIFGFKKIYYNKIDYIKEELKKDPENVDRILHLEKIPEKKQNQLSRTGKNIMIGSFIIVSSYFGFDILIKLNGESKNPYRDIPRAMNHSMIFVIFLYTIIGYVYGDYIKDDKNRITNDALVSMSSYVENTNKLKKILTVGGTLLTLNTSMLAVASLSRLIMHVGNNINNNGNNNGNNKNKIPTKQVIAIIASVMILTIYKFKTKNAILISNTSMLVLIISVVVACNKLGL